MKKKILYIIGGIITFLLLCYVIVGFITPYKHLQTAIFYAYRGSTIASLNDSDKMPVQTAKKTQEWQLSSDYNTKKMSEITEKTHQKYKSVAFLVIQNHQIKFEKYWENYDQNSLSNSFSMAKSLVALCIGIAIEEGKIKNINQKVGDFLPEFQKDGKNNITIKDLLTMSSGLKWSEEYKNPISDVVRAYFEPNLYEMLTQVPVEKQAGKTWKYSSGDTQILGLILEKATKQPLSQYASEKIWQKIGAKNTAYWFVDKNKNTKAFCCLHSNARDFAKLAQLVLQEGKWNDEQIVPQNFIKEALAPADYLKDKEKKEPVMHYGYQFWRVKYKDKYYPCFRGVLGQYMILIPEKNAIVVRLGHKRAEKMINFCPEDLFVYLEEGLKMLN
jgi:CubicO group peptidase (beta-lactamase class C family)